MTDELERLLSEEQEAPEQVAEVLNLRAAEYSVARKGEGAAAVETGEEFPNILSGEDGTAFFSRQAGNTDGEEELRREDNARTLYRTLTRTGQAVKTAVLSRESSRTPLVRQSTPAADPGRDALWLDRIFQRDARRYDGGFTWQ